MSDDLSPTDRAKYAAAAVAVSEVQDGMKIGLGTGSTADWMLRCLARRIRDEGIGVTGVPTSFGTRARAEALGIPLGDLDDLAPLDLAIDGADEVDGKFRLIKGGGGALLQEKIVATAARRMLVIADTTKLVGTLGAAALPVEVICFGAGVTEQAIARILQKADVDTRDTAWRVVEGNERYVTEEGHFILDLKLGRIGDPAALDAMLRALPGVVETGLFLSHCSALCVGYPNGRAEIYGPARPYVPGPPPDDLPD